MRSLLVLLLFPLGSLAQTAMPTEFPADALRVNAETLRARLSGKVFRVKPADGSSWRIEYKANGYAFIDISNGFRDTGSWHVEDGKLCSDWHRANGGCSEARLKGESIYIKRVSNGEVIALVE